MAQAVRAVEQRRAARPEADSRKPAAGSRELEAGSAQPSAVGTPAQLKEAFLDEVRRAKKFFYGTVVAQAQRIDLTPDAVTFVFAPQHRALRVQLEQSRPWLEETASRLAGRKMTVGAADGPPSSPASAAPARPAGRGETPPAGNPDGADRSQELKDRALADNGVQAMLDVFAAEIKDVEEM